jgi:hypothetical protein
VELLKTILTGAAGAALVGGIFGIIMWCLNRKAAKEDAAKVDVASVCATRGKTIEDLSKMVSSLIVADRTILYDRIKHLAKAYIKRGWISVEEFEDLKRMHDVYHDELEGNGFLNDLMAAVAKLEKKVL